MSTLNGHSSVKTVVNDMDYCVNCMMETVQRPPLSLSLISFHFKSPSSPFPKHCRKWGAPESSVLRDESCGGVSLRVGVASTGAGCVPALHLRNLCFVFPVVRPLPCLKERKVRE